MSLELERQPADFAMFWPDQSGPQRNLNFAIEIEDTKMCKRNYIRNIKS